MASRTITIPATTDLAHEHNQTVPATTWTITHTLPFEPSVTLVDSSGAEFFADVHHTTGTVTVTLAAAVAGTAYLS